MGVGVEILRSRLPECPSRPDAEDRLLSDLIDAPREDELGFFKPARASAAVNADTFDDLVHVPDTVPVLEPSRFSFCHLSSSSLRGGRPLRASYFAAQSSRSTSRKHTPRRP